MLILNMNRKPYMGNPVAPSHLTLSDLERSKSRLQIIEALRLVKEPYIGIEQ